jgi:hypothetical protein
MTQEGPGRKPEEFANREIFRPLFIRSVGWLLLLTAILKIVSAAQATPFLALPNGVLPFLSNRAAMLMAALLELSIALLIASRPGSTLALDAITWFATLIVIYRVGFILLDVPLQTCPCLGNVGSWVGLNERVVRGVSNLIFAFLVAGSFGLQLQLRLRTRNTNNKHCS